MKKPAVCIGFAAMISSALCSVYPELCAAAAVIILAVGTVIFIVNKYLGGETERIRALLLICLSAAAAAAMYLCAVTYIVTPLQSEFDGRLTDFSGTVISEPMTVRQTTSFVIKTNTINGVPRRVKLRALSSTVIKVGVNGTVSGRGVFYAVTRDRAQSYSDGIFLETKIDPSADEYLTVNRKGESVLSDMRKRIRAGFSRVLSADEAQLCAAMITGGRSAVSSFYKIGISHLLVVSGLHISIIAALLMMLSGMIRQPYVRGALVILGVMSYAVLTGMGFSVIRAMSMFVIMELGALFWYKSDAQNSIGIAAMLVCLDPFASGDIGVLWSFSCAGMMVTFTEPMEKLISSALRIRRGKTLAAALCAFIGSLPFFVVSSGRLSLMTIPANLLTAPAEGVLLFAGVPAAIFLLLGLNAPAKLFMAVSGLAAKYMILTADFLSRIPNKGMPVDKRFAVTLILAALTAAAAFAIVKGKSAKLSELIVFSLLASAVCGLVFACFPKTVLSVLDVGDGMTVVLKHRDSAYVLCSFGQSSQYPTISKELRRSGTVAALVDVRVDKSYNYGRRISSDFAPAVIVVRDERQNDYSWNKYCGADIETAGEGRIMSAGDIYADMYFTDTLVCEMIYIGYQRVLICYGSGGIPPEMRDADIAVVCDAQLMPQLSDVPEVILSSNGGDVLPHGVSAATCGAGRIDITFEDGAYSCSREYTGGVITYAGDNGK